MLAPGVKKPEIRSPEIDGFAVVTLPKYEVAPPVTEWSAEDIAIDLFHHAVYIGAAAKAYELLGRAAD